MEIAIVSVIKEGVIQEHFPFKGDKQSVALAAERKFLELCHFHNPSFSESDQDAHVEDGYMEIDPSSSVCLSWIDPIPTVTLGVEGDNLREFYATATISLKIQCPADADIDEVCESISSEADYGISFIDRKAGISILDTTFESIEAN